MYRKLIVLIVALLALTLAGNAAADNASPAASTYTGTLTVIVGDPMPTAGEPMAPIPPIFTLILSDGRELRLLPGAAGENDLLRLAGQRVSVTLPAAEAEAALATDDPAAAGVAVASVVLAPGAVLASPEVSGNTKWLTIACKFADVVDEPRPLNFFQNMYASTYPGLDHYWREASYDKINLAGSTAVGWYTLPYPLSRYVDGQSVYLAELFMDCTAAADSEVNFADFFGINLEFNANIGCCAWGGKMSAYLDGISRTWATTWLPLWGYPYLSNVQHEMAHAYGIYWHPITYGMAYIDGWDVVSSTHTHCHFNTPDPIYGCIGQHMSAYNRHYLGWIPESRVVIVPPGRTTISLEQLTLPQTDRPLMALVPIDGSMSHYYVVEARRRVGNDTQLVANSLVIHEIGGAQSMELMGSFAGSQYGPAWEAGHIWAAPRGNLTVTVDENLATGYRITVETGLNVRTMALPPLEDTYTNQYSPGTNYGGSPTLVVREDLSPPYMTYRARNAFLGFDPAALPQRIISARLQLTADGALPATWPTVGSVALCKGCLTAPAPFDEYTLTYNTVVAQGIDSHMPRIFNPISVGPNGYTYEINGVINHWGPDGLNMLALSYATGHHQTGDTYDTFRFYSKEGVAPPQLIIDYLVPPNEPTTTTFTPTNDAYVMQARPKAVYGTKASLQVKDAAADVNTYLKFNVKDLTGSVQSATLRLFVKDPGPDGGKVYATSPFYRNATALWLETGLKWTNAPAIAGTPLDAAGPVALGQWVELDVTSAVVAALNDNGRVSLALTNDSRNLVTYSSKEGAKPPELVVVTN